MKINIEFDTETKVCAVKENGQTLEGVTSVEIYKDYEDADKSFINIRQVAEEKEGATKVTTTFAARAFADAVLSNKV